MGERLIMSKTGGLYMNELQKADELILELVDALKKAARQFRYYQAQHQLKTPPDTTKAKTNQEFAEMLEEIISKTSEAS